jgi:superfamily II DNA/RNA helicase
VVRALSRRDITKPFPVQEMVVRDALDGHDLLVQSPTGSGKTLAFGIPMVDRLEPSQGRASALVLAPTRELAGQIVDELSAIAASRELKLTAVYGGVGYGPQARAARRADIIVATPGRLEDLMSRGDVDLKGIQILVLDEADRMLDMGFKPAVSRIVGRTPSDRQTLFFSATLEGATGQIAKAFTTDARRHTQERDEKDHADIEHRFLHVTEPSAKLDHLVDQLEHEDSGPTLVFVRTKRGADRLAKRLRSRNVDAVVMHGNKSQRQREQALARFERGDVDALIATDVASRGIDVDGITHVVNFDAPGDTDAYVHRVGRTGRAGRRGIGISFVLADQTDEVRRMAGDLGLSREFDHGRRGSERSESGNKRRKNHNRNRRRAPQ